MPIGEETWCNMNLPDMSRKKLLGYYIISVCLFALVLIAVRWQESVGFWAHMDMISLSIWQAIVWPLYIIVKALG